MIGFVYLCSFVYFYVLKIISTHTHHFSPPNPFTPIHLSVSSSGQVAALMNCTLFLWLLLADVNSSLI